MYHINHRHNTSLRHEIRQAKTSMYYPVIEIDILQKKNPGGVMRSITYFNISLYDVMAINM
jgi:hypothetical protein